MGVGVMATTSQGITVTHGDRRTDPLRPQVFDPADVDVLEYVDLKPPSVFVDPALIRLGFGADILKEARMRRAQWEAAMTRLFGTPAPARQCAHCGHPGIRWAWAVRYRPTGQVFAFGEICGGERAVLPDRGAFDRRAAKAAAERDRERRERHDRMVAYMQAEPDIVAFLGSVLDANGMPADRSTFVNDMVVAFDRWGALTERQTAAVRRIMQQRELDHEAPTPAVVREGRHEIEGTVVSTRIERGQWGETYRMLVKDDDGRRYWGNVPRALWSTWSAMQVPGAVRVKFTATVAVSDRDESFGFFSRPTKASAWVVEGGADA